MTKKDEARRINIGLRGEQVYHRWDTVSGVRVITFFTRNKLIATVSEVDHLVQSYKAAFNGGEDAGHSTLDDVTWLHKMERFLSAYAYREKNPVRDIAIYESLPTGIKQNAEMSRMLVAVREFGETLKDRVDSDTSPIEQALVRAGRLYQMNEESTHWEKRSQR